MLVGLDVMLVGLDVMLVGLGKVMINPEILIKIDLCFKASLTLEIEAKDCSCCPACQTASIWEELNSGAGYTRLVAPSIALLAWVLQACTDQPGLASQECNR